MQISKTHPNSPEGDSGMRRFFHRKEMTALLVLGMTMMTTMSFSWSGKSETCQIQTSISENGRVLVKGCVKDASGKPLPGVSVIIKGSRSGVATDGKGRFEISARPDHSVLVFSFIGMETREITLSRLKDLQNLEIVMEEREELLEDVVVTGYANIRKESFTGSSTQVKKEDLLKVSSHNLIDALQVFDPSLRVMTNNEMGSDPNTLPEFYVRGRSGMPSISQLDKYFGNDKNLSKFALTENPNAPIFILDGYEVSSEKIYDMDINRIAGVTILKDAAATAMYGSRASNGVIVIQTVAPRRGEIKVSYNFTGEVTAPDLSDYNMMNSREKLEAEVAYGLLDGTDVLPTEDYSGLTRMEDYLIKANNIARGVDTYWLSKPLETQFNHRHSLYIEGGEKSVRWGLDLNYASQNGVMKESGRNNMGIGFTLDYRWKGLQFRNTASADIMRATNSPYGSFRDYVSMQPYDTPYDIETGKLLKTLPIHYGRDREIPNPLWEATLKSFDKNEYKEFSDNLSVNWEILEGLQFKGQFSISSKNASSDKFIDPNSGNYGHSNRLAWGELNQSSTDSWAWNTNLSLWYNNTIGKHNINFNLGFNAKEDRGEYKTQHYEGFPTGDLHDPQYAHSSDKPEFSDVHTRLMGTFAVLNYTFDNTYLLDFSVRGDGSSEFGADKRFAPFWSVGGGVNLHRYSIIKDNLEFINQFKIRANYGVTGKLNFPPYAARHTYRPMLDSWYTTGIGSVIHYLGNENLKWEKQHQLNIGTDIQAFDGRLTLDFNWYDKRTKDLVNDITLPSSSGFPGFKDNVGEIQNKGFELNLNAAVFSRGDWDVRVYGNMAHNKNKILEISSNTEKYNERIDQMFAGYYYNTNQRGLDKFAIPFTKFENGSSLTSIYGMKSMGIAPANGTEIFVKKDGSVTYNWSSQEQQILGNTEPKVQGSFGINVRYKGFTLYTSFLYELGGQAYNSTLANKVEFINLYTTNADKRVLEERWRKPGDVSRFKDIKMRLLPTQPTSRFVEDNNMLKFNSLSLSYDLPASWLKHIRLSQARLQFHMKDVAVFSSMKQERGLDYPFARAFDFSLNLSF